MVGRMFRDIQDTYYAAYEEACLNDAATEAKMLATEMMLENQRTIDEIKSRCNRREKYDDEGNVINDNNNTSPIMPTYLPKNGYESEKSWMCDKCMAINFGCQTSCPECGDIKDWNDEIIG